MTNSYYRMVNRHCGELLRDYMQRAGHSVSAAAKLAGVHRTHFYKLLQRYAPDAKPKQVPAGNDAWRALQ